MSNSMQLEHVHPDTLKPYPNNPHTHPKSQLKQIKASLLANGVIGAILVDETSEIINGEAVWRVSKEIGLQSLPVLRVYGLTEIQKRKLRIGLNKHADNAEWDADALRVEITDTGSLRPLAARSRGSARIFSSSTIPPNPTKLFRTCDALVPITGFLRPR
jgi:ParB-like chromosome segregation protein Spo0J